MYFEVNPRVFQVYSVEFGLDPGITNYKNLFLIERIKIAINNLSTQSVGLHELIKGNSETKKETKLAADKVAILIEELNTEEVKQTK